MLFEIKLMDKTGGLVLDALATAYGINNGSDCFLYEDYENNKAINSIPLDSCEFIVVYEATTGRRIEEFRRMDYV